jgi:hypothetical protein
MFPFLVLDEERSGFHLLLLTQQCCLWFAGNTPEAPQETSAKSGKFQAQYYNLLTIFKDTKQQIDSLQRNMSYHQTLASTTFLLLVSTSFCFAQFLNDNALQTTPPASTASPSFDSGGILTCDDQTNAFVACSTVSTAPPVDYDACGLCLDSFDYWPTGIDLTTAPCDDLSAYILGEAGKCGTECFPTTNDCSDEYLAVIECYLIDTLARDRCASDIGSGTGDGSAADGGFQTDSPSTAPPVFGSGIETASPTAIVASTDGGILTDSPSASFEAQDNGFQTISPSNAETCADQSDTYISCASSNTAAAVDYDACDACLEAKVDYNPTGIDFPSASCQDLISFIRNEVGKCQAECFPAGNECNDGFLALSECHFIEAVAKDRCGSGSDSNNNSNTGGSLPGGNGSTSNGDGEEAEDNNGGGFLGGAGQGAKEGTEENNRDEASGVVGVFSVIPAALAATSMVVWATIF